MKILHVIPSYEPAWAFGGTVTATANLCRALVKRGLDVTVYTTNSDGKGGQLDVPIGREINVGGVKVYYFPSQLGGGGAFYSGQLSRFLDDTVQKNDIVHISAVWQWIQVSASSICRKYGVPYLLSTHGSLNPWSWTQKTLKKNVYWQLFGRQTFKTAAAIHYTCREERSLTRPLFAGAGNASNFLVPNGICLTKRTMQIDIRKRLNVAPDKKILLYAGRIHRKKGLDLIIKAMRSPGLERFILLMVGHVEDSEYARYLKSLSSGMADRIIWHPAVAAEEVWDFYLCADLFVLPSQDENFGMVVVEAMSCGLPVLISREVGIWKDIEEDGSGVVVGRDEMEIASRLGDILRAPDLLKHLSGNACDSVRRRYNIDRTSELMSLAYTDVLTGGRSEGLQWE